MSQLLVLINARGSSQVEGMWTHVNSSARCVCLFARAFYYLGIKPDASPFRAITYSRMNCRTICGFSKKGA